MRYFDFKKAFDCVPHLRMLHNLNKWDKYGRNHSWIRSFLPKRTLRVKVGGEYYRCIDVTSAIPHGSVLGPFSCYIDNCLNGKVRR